MRFLCAADLHLGRRSSRLHEEVRGTVLSTIECWSRIVEAAVEHEVDAVLLAGDVVDEEHKYFAALGPLETGVRRLAGEGITTVAVAGNHDHDVLPALAREMEEGHFRVLGARGAWERVTLLRNGARAHVDGWSFPGRHCERDPLSDYPYERDPAVPAIGLLHCDLDVPGSRYAPVALGGLRARAPVAWVLGHVHAARLREGPGAPVLYPGSPQALDPGEPGVHGAWIVDVGGSGATARLLPLSTVRYETREVSVDGVEEADALRAAVVQAMREAAAEAADDPGALRHLSLRLRLTGRTALHAALRDLLRERDVREHVEEAGPVTARVERIEPATAPAVDLLALAGLKDAPGVVASLVAAIRTGELDEGQRALLEDVAARIERVRRSPAYLPLDPTPTGPGEAREIVEAQALLLLDVLLRQREAA